MTDSPRWCELCEAWGDHHTDRCPRGYPSPIDAVVSSSMDAHVRLAIVGSTEFHDDAVLRPEAEELIEELLDVYRPTWLVSGGARGIDQIAEKAARRRGIIPLIHRPKHPRWEPEGYKERNTKIAEDCTHLVAIRHPLSKTYGSGWTADLAEKLGRPVERIKMKLL